MADPGVERRLAAILAADVVGYSRLMAADEEETLARLRGLRREFIDPTIARHHGRIVKLMGDGVLVEFASVVDAVRCAADIQRGMAERDPGLSEDQRIRLRIGVNLGDILIEDDDIYGDGVNVAARLEGLAEPGGIVISGTAFDHAKKAEAGFRYIGRQQVRNIPEPVRAYQVLLDPEAVGSVVDDEVPAAPARRRWPTLAAAAAALLVLAGVGFWLWYAYWRLPTVEAASVERMAFPLPDKPSIAVLPFANVSAEPGQDYFADGITEDIVVELSKVSGLFVIAHNSTSTYKDKPVEIRDVAEDLGVRYVLDGSVRRAGDQVRIAAQLVDATSGRYLWAERYDRDLAGIFDIQDEVTRKVVAELAVTLKADENERLFRPHTENFEAYDLFLRARKAWDPPTDENLLKGEGLFQQVIEHDPEFAGGYAGLSLMHSLFVQFGSSTEPEEDLARAYELARKAVEVDDAFGWAHTALGTAHLMRGEHDQAVMQARAAVRVQPGDADAHSYLGYYLHWAGRGEEAVEAVETAIRLNPQFLLGSAGRFRAFLGYAQFTAGRYAECSETLSGLIKRFGTEGAPAATILVYLAACYSALGRDTEARKTIEVLLEKNPDLSISSWNYLHLHKRSEDRERLWNALRRAGLPEHPPIPLPDKPSIAVLPFDNLSGDPEQDYFSDGMTEDLITDLSKISGLSVAARNAAFQYKDQRAVDPEEIARNLGVRYVLEGSVRKAEDRIRINAQLIDASNGYHLWAERYDRDLEDIFALQDEIAAQIVTALQVQLTEDESEILARRFTDDVEAYDLYLQGYDLYRIKSKANVYRARELFVQAIAHDPNFAAAYARLSHTHFVAWDFGWEGAEALDRAVDLAKKAVALNDSSPEAHEQLGFMYVMRKDFDAAISEVERAVVLDPDYAKGYARLGEVLAYAGRPEESAPLVEKAMAMEPYVWAHWYQWILGLANHGLGQYDAAIQALRRCLAKSPKFFPAHVHLTAVYGELGRTDEAKAAAAKVLEQNPEFSVAEFGARWPIKDRAFKNRLIEGLRKAGLPE